MTFYIPLIHEVGTEPVPMRDPNGGVRIPKKLNDDWLIEWGMEYALAAVKIGICRIIGCFGTLFWDVKIGICCHSKIAMSSCQNHMAMFLLLQTRDY